MAAAKKALRKPTTQQQPDNDNPDVDEEELGDTTADEVDGDSGDESDSEETTSVDVAPVAAEEPERLMGAPRDGRTFRTGETVIVKGKEQGGFIVVQEPVYRASRTPQSSRWRFHLLFARGAEIPKGQTKEVKAEPGTFEAGPAY